jgi:hypothetical protein
LVDVTTPSAASYAVIVYVPGGNESGTVKSQLKEPPTDVTGDPPLHPTASGPIVTALIVASDAKYVPFRVVAVPTSPLVGNSIVSCGTRGVPEVRV